MNLIVEIEDGVWLAHGIGDPSRTLVQENAKVFTSMSSAYRALEKAMMKRKLKSPKVVEMA